jgi:hypothetical protein
MQFTTSALVALLAYTSSTAASPVQARQTTLKDFEVSSVTVFTPSGRPGSYPWATITANVTDPNEINLGTAESDGSQVIVPAGSQGLVCFHSNPERSQHANITQNCKATYFTKGESPVGRTWPCDSTSSGYWTMQVLPGSEGAYSSNNFNLKFRHVADVLYRGSQYTASFEAQGLFAIGDNLSGTCGGSGVCSWGLKDDKKPFPIKPSKV